MFFFFLILWFIILKKVVESIFNKNYFSDYYWIHRPRRNFPDHIDNLEREDTFHLMAKRGIQIIYRIVIEKIKGVVDLKNDVWNIPIKED